MKILSYQSFSVYANGGGSRILRRMYKGREQNVYSLAIEAGYYKPVTGIIQETIVPAIPLRRPWMKWRSREVFNWIRDKPLRQYTTNRIRREASSIACDVVHVMGCGGWSTVLCDDPLFSQKPLWVSVHDHHRTTQCSEKDARELWNRADRRLMISNELGKDYQRIFGKKEFELITDGLLAHEVSAVAAKPQSPYTIYFAGLLHIEYIPLFKALADALDKLTKNGLSFKLILRGTQQLSFLNTRSFETQYLPMVLDDAELKRDLDAAAILYLPIKFVDPDFYLYSLSTKMVGYLGASGSTLYHGPADSAACNLLRETGSAICCNSLNTEDLVLSILQLVEGNTDVSVHAKQLAQTMFDLKEIQDRFWQEGNQVPNRKLTAAGQLSV
jgi:hypothetical protein